MRDRLTAKVAEDFAEGRKGQRCIHKHLCVLCENLCVLLRFKSFAYFVQAVLVTVQSALVPALTAFLLRIEHDCKP